MDISGRRTREPSVRSISMDRLVADAHTAQERERGQKLSDRINYQLSARGSSNSPTRRYDHTADGSTRGRKSTRVNRTLRLDDEGREKEQRKVSHRENYVDTGPVVDHPMDEVYDYDSSSENNVRYLNDADPVPTKLRKSPDRKSHRTVDTIIPTVPKLNMPSNGHDSFGSMESRDTKEGACSPPTSSRSEKLQRTLKNISLNETEPFPGVRARIVRQREQEKQLKFHDEVTRSSPNSNNNALADEEEALARAKPSHTEDDVVHLSSSPESVIVRPIKRKVATAPEVSNKTRAPVRRSGVNATSSASAVGRSKMADSKRPTAAAAKWVDKTPGKAASSGQAAKRTQSEVIRPDSWRKGMAIVRRELKQNTRPSSRREGSDDSQPSSARSEKSTRSNQSHRYEVDKASQLPRSAQQVLEELRDGDGEPDLHSEAVNSRPSASTRPKRRVIAKVEPERVEPLPKQRHYDTESVQRFMEKKKKEKRLQELEERKKKQQEDKARKEKLKMLQDRSRKVVSHSSIKPPVMKPTAKDSTFTAYFTGVAPVPRAVPSMQGGWAPVTNSASYTVNTEAAVEPMLRSSSNEHSVLSEGEGDTTLTEAELQAETPTKHGSHSSSKSSTPRSRRESPLLARSKAAEEEIEQLVQAAKQRNQSARQIQAQATPLKQIDQLGSTTDTTSSSTDYRRSLPNAQQSVKSARIASLAQTTAQLMTKMSMLQADLENSAMSRSNSRCASSFGQVMNTSFSPREPAGYTVGQRPSYAFAVQDTVKEQSVTSDSVTEDYNTQSTVTDSSRSQSTVTSESEHSDNESELSSLDLRIREALARPSNFVSSYARAQAKSPKELVKPVARVSRALTYEERGDGHSVINTYLRKLKADKEALAVDNFSRITPSTFSAVPVTSTSVSTMTTQTLTTLSTTGIQTELPRTTHTAFMSTRLADMQPSTVPPTTAIKSASVPSTTTRAAAISEPKTASCHVNGGPQRPSQYPASRHLQPPAAVTQSSYSQSSVSQAVPPPAYTSQTSAGVSTQSRRISPAGLDLALSAGITLLEGINQQHVQLSDVERTRFSTLAQQETVALAQILKGNKEKQEQQLFNLRHKIKQDEAEAQEKLAQFKREAELSNRRREEAERHGEREALKLSKDATRRVLEAQNESTKAFTEAAKLLAERREKLADSESQISGSTQTVVNSLRVQNEAVAASLTTLVDQQRQQNMEILRMARLEPQSQQSVDALDRKHSPRHVTRTSSPREVKSPRGSKKHRDSAMSPRDAHRLSREMARSPKDSNKSSDDSDTETRDATKSPRISKSPRSRKLRSPKDRQFHDILERSDISSGSSRRSDETVPTASAVSYSDDFGSDKSSITDSPAKRSSPPHTRTHSSGTEARASRVNKDLADSSIPTDIDSLSSPVKDDSTQTDSSKELLSHIASSKLGIKEPSTLGSRTSTKAEESRESKSRSSESSASSPTAVDTQLQKVVLGAVKEVFKDGSPAQLQSEHFYDKLKSVLYTLKEGGAGPTAPLTAGKSSPVSSPNKPPMVAPLSPRIDRNLSMRRHAGQRASSRSNFAVDSESDESHSLLAEKRMASGQERKQKKETASDTDQECQLSALQHQLDEAKRRHAMMKKARQKYEFQKKQDAYKKQIEYYEDDMARMKREMEDLAAMHSSGSTAATSSMRPKIKQPRAPSSSGSENGKQRHSSGASEGDLSTHQPTVIQKPLVGKSLGQLSSTRQVYERQRSDSGRSADSELDRQREKTPEYGDDFETEHSSKTDKDVAEQTTQNQLSAEPVLPAKDSARTDTDGDYAYSNGFDDKVRSSDSVTESIVDSINESLQSSKRLSEGSLSQASDLLHLDDSPSLKAAASSAEVSPNKTDFLEEPSLLDLKSEPKVDAEPPAPIEEGIRSRSLSDASSHTIVEAKSDSRSSTPTWSRSHHSRSPTPRSKSRSSQDSFRSRSPASRSRSPVSRSSSPSNRSRSPAGRSRSSSRRSRSSSRRSRSPASASRSLKSRSRSPSRSRSRSRTISEASIVSEVVESPKEPSDNDIPLLDLGTADEPAQTITSVQDEDKVPAPAATTETVEDVVESYASDFSPAPSEHESSTITDSNVESATDNEKSPRIDSKSPAVEADRFVVPSRSPDQKISQSEEERDKSDESIIDELLESAYEESEKQETLLSLKDELDAALALSSSPAASPREGKVQPELQTDERLAESTPRLNDSDAEAREQRDFDELEKLMTGETSRESSDSRLSLDSKSPDFLEFSTKSHDQQKSAEHSSSAKEVGKAEERSDEESELEKAISTAAAAVESFATDLEIDELNQTGSQADVGLSVMEETTPRSLMSLDSSADDLLDDGQTTPQGESPPADDNVYSGEVTPRGSSDADKLETDLSEKSIQEADDHQLEAATSDLIDKSFDSVVELWRNRRAELKAAAASAVDDSTVVPKLSLAITAHETTPPLSTTPTSSTSAVGELSPTKPVSPVTSPIKEKSDKVTSSTKELAVSPEEMDKITHTQDKSATSSPTSLLGTLPPLVVKTPKAIQLSAAKSPPDSHSSSSSEESVSPVKSPTKLSFVEEARHEQWAQLDKEIDNVFGANDNDWFDDDFGLGPESKPASVLPTREMLNRVVVPEPVFVVPHEDVEVRAIADSALDIFWQARRCGESWDSVAATSQFLDIKDKLELEASSTAAFKQFMFDLIRDMLADIYQNEDGGAAANPRLSRGPLSRYYRHRQPPTTLDQVREIIHKQIHPAVTGKLVHPSKSSRVMSVVRNKRRDKVDTILIQELREEEPNWLDYTQDEQSVKQALVEEVFKVLLDDSISAVYNAYNTVHNIKPTTEL